MNRSPAEKKPEIDDLEVVQRCDLCGASSFKPELALNGWHLVRCNACGLVFTSPRLKESYLLGTYKSNYYERDSRYLSTVSPPSSEDDRCLALWVKDHSIKNQSRTLRSLDIGCGAGRITHAFENAGFEAVGIDFSDTAVNLGRRLGLDLRTTPVGDEELGDFDVITCFHVLEHVSSPRSFLHKCARHLRKNGLLVLEVPDYGCRTAKKMGKQWLFLYPDMHLYQFTIETIAGYLRQANFSKLQTNRVYGRGPLRTASPSHKDRPKKGRDIKECIFALRYLIYRSSRCKKILRHLLWDTLGYGEWIRVLAKKADDPTPGIW